MPTPGYDPNAPIPEKDWSDPNSPLFTNPDFNHGNWRFNAQKGEWEVGNTNMDVSNGLTNTFAPGAIPPELNGYPKGIASQQQYVDMTRAGANAAPNANPYSAIVANQARPAQEALYNQMRTTQAGPSIAGMQGTRAQGQNLQSAVAAGGGAPIMNKAASIGTGLANDTAMGTLAEQLRMSSGIGGLAGGVRAADLGVARDEANSGLQQRGLDDTMRQFYAQQGSGLNNTIGRNELEEFKLRERLRLNAKKAQDKAEAGLAQAGATVLAM